MVNIINYALCGCIKVSRKFSLYFAEFSGFFLRIITETCNKENCTGVTLKPWMYLISSNEEKVLWTIKPIICLCKSCHVDFTLFSESSLEDHLICSDSLVEKTDKEKEEENKDVLVCTDFKIKAKTLHMHSVRIRNTNKLYSLFKYHSRRRFYNIIHPAYLYTTKLNHT